MIHRLLNLEPCKHRSNIGALQGFEFPAVIHQSPHMGRQSAFDPCIGRRWGTRGASTEKDFEHHGCFVSRFEKGKVAGKDLAK